MTLFLIVLLSMQNPRPPARCQQTLETVTVCQRCYAALTSTPFAGRAYLYASDIKSGLFGNFEPFNLWIVEGVYGRPFPKSTGPLEEQAFEQLRKSRNVITTAIKVDKAFQSKLMPFSFSKQPFLVEITRVDTSLAGTDKVTARICR